MKIPTDEGIPMFLLCTAIADKEQTNIQLTHGKNCLLGCIQSSAAKKKTTEDILNKIYTEKGTVTDIWLVLFTVDVRTEFTGFQSGNNLADARTAGRRWLAIWVHSDSLIKNLTPLENNAEIRLLNFPMYANNSQKIHSKLISTLQFLSN